MTKASTSTTIGVLETVAESLDDDAAWVAAAALSEDGSSSNVQTLRSHFLRALSCDPKAGALAYWDWREINDRVNDCWASLAPVVGANPEMWSNEKDRTRTEILRALRAAEIDLPAPAVPFQRREWAVPSLVRTCRIPYVPIASVFHIALAQEKPLGTVLGELAITSLSLPWDILDRADPIARELQPPDSVGGFAEAARTWMTKQMPPQYSPAKALHAAATVLGDRVNLEHLQTWAGTSKGAVD